MWKIRGEEMEENMFHDFLLGYQNVSQELMNLDFIDRSIEIERLEQLIQRREEFIQQCEREDAQSAMELAIEIVEKTKEKIETIKRQEMQKRERKSQLETTLKNIRQKAKAKEKEIMEKEKKENPIELEYATCELDIERIKDELLELAEKLEKLQGPSRILEEQKGTVKKYNLVLQLKEMKKKIRLLKQKLPSKKIQRDYILLLGQMSILDKKIEDSHSIQMKKQQQYEGREREKEKEYEKLTNSAYLQFRDNEYERELEQKQLEER